MLISVILPVFNRERYLAAAIESVLQQTFTDYELIVVDDGSVDGSYDLALSFAKQYPEKIRVLRQPNGGPAKARNTALRECKGSHIAFIDSDDLWPPDKLEEQVKVARLHRDFAFIYTGYYVMDGDGKRLRECRPDTKFSGDIHDLLLLHDNEISGGTLLVEREKLFDIKGFDEALPGAENLDLRLRLSKLGQVFYCDKPLYYYRRHGSNLTGNETSMSASYLKVLEKHLSRDCATYRKVIAKYYYHVGIICFGKMRLGEARSFFINSVRNDMMRGDCYVRILRCLLGERINRFLSCRRKQWETSLPG